MHLLIHLPTHPSSHPSIYLPINPSICPFTYFPFRPPAAHLPTDHPLLNPPFICLPTHPHIHSLTYTSAYHPLLHVCISTQHPLLNHLGIHLSTHLSISQSTHLPIHLPIHSFIYSFIHHIPTNDFIFVFTMCSFFHFPTHHPP